MMKPHLYIDIVERTGAAIYDVELKARLGDLSGLSSGLLFGETVTRFWFVYRKCIPTRYDYERLVR